MVVVSIFIFLFWFFGTQGSIFFGFLISGFGNLGLMGGLLIMVAMFLPPDDQQPPSVGLQNTP